MAAINSNNQSKVKTSEQTDVKLKEQGIIMSEGADSIGQVEFNLKLGCFFARGLASVSRNKGPF